MVEVSTMTEWHGSVAAKEKKKNRSVARFACGCDRENGEKLY